jgi:hypothetical protein
LQSRQAERPQTKKGQNVTKNTMTGAAKPEASTKTEATKDAGRVHIGGGMMRFDTTKDAGRVHIGGGMMRF